MFTTTKIIVVARGAPPFYSGGQMFGSPGRHTDRDTIFLLKRRATLATFCKSALHSTFLAEVIDDPSHGGSRIFETPTFERHRFPRHHFFTSADAVANSSSSSSDSFRCFWK
jgi:hypothetical protein